MTNLFILIQLLVDLYQFRYSSFYHFINFC